MKTTSHILLVILLFCTQLKVSGQLLDPVFPIISNKLAQKHLAQIKTLGINKSDPKILMDLSMHHIYQLKTNKEDLGSTASYLAILHQLEKSKNNPKSSLKIDILQAVLSSKLGDSAFAANNLNNLIEKTTKAGYNELLAWAYYELAINNRPKQTITLLEKAFNSAAKGSDKLLKVNIGHVFAYRLSNNKEYDKAIKVLISCDPEVSKLKNEELGKFYATKSNVYAGADNKTESLKWALTSLGSYQQSKDSVHIADAYYAVGRAYKNISEWEKSLPYIYKAMTLYEAQGNNFQINFSAEQIAMNYWYLGKFQLAIDKLTYYTKKYPTNVAGIKYRIARAFLRIYTDMDDHKNASYYEKLLIGPTFQQFMKDSDMILGAYYYNFKDYKNARIYLQRIVDQKVHAPYSIERLARIDSIEGDYKSALKNYRLFTNYMDSTKSTDRQLLIRDMRYNFDIKEKDFALTLKDADIKLKQKDLLTVKQHNELLAKDAKLKASQLQTAKLQGQKNTTELKLKDQNITFLNKQSASQQKTLSLQMRIRNIVIVVVILCLVVIYLLIRQYKIKQSSERLLASQNTELEQLVKEKSWLLKEMHHRVKNNLQIVISLLNAQYSHLDSEVAMAAIQESQHRMHSISLIHQKLYQSDNLAYIDMKEYINELVNYLNDSFDTNRRIKIVQEVKPIGMDVAQAVPMGLILNEAITNAIKYAFNPQEKGEINISLDEIDSQTLSLVIADNGKGMPKDFDIKTTSSLGMTLIKGLGKQLGGDLKLTNKNGLTIHMLIKRVEILIRNEQLTTENS